MPRSGSRLICSIALLALLGLCTGLGETVQSAESEQVGGLIERARVRVREVALRFEPAPDAPETACLDLGLDELEVQLGRRVRGRRGL